MKNKEVFMMYKGKPYLKTNIVLFTPISNELKEEIAWNFNKLPKILKEMDVDIQNKIMDTFESDVAEVITGTGNIGKIFEK